MPSDGEEHGLADLRRMRPGGRDGGRRRQPMPPAWSRRHDANRRGTETGHDGTSLSWARRRTGATGVRRVTTRSPADRTVSWRPHDTAM